MRVAYGDNSLWSSDWGNNRATKANSAGSVMWLVEVGSWPIGLAIDEVSSQIYVGFLYEREDYSPASDCGAGGAAVGGG